MTDYDEDELMGQREPSRFQQEVVLAETARRIGFSISEGEELESLYCSHLEDKKYDE